jgi:hypothetical protein
LYCSCSLRSIYHRWEIGVGRMKPSAFAEISLLQWK